MYLKAKQYFIQLSNQGHESATILLEEYEELKESNGEFVAALFLRNVYIDFQLNMDRVKNG